MASRAAWCAIIVLAGHALPCLTAAVTECDLQPITVFSSVDSILQRENAMSDHASWPRDSYTGPGGGLYTGPGGGRYTGPGGGLYTGPGGGLYTGPGGGLYTGPGGGLYTGPGGGMYTGPGGGLYTGPAEQPYRSNWPTRSFLVEYLESRGMDRLANELRKAWRIPQPRSAQ